MEGDPSAEKPSFEQLSEAPPPSLLAEFLDFLRHNKKWWLLPILLVLLFLGALLLFSGSAAAPFIYTLF
jgi:uncharacterized protein DUF5989